VFLILNQINYSMHKNNENYFFNSSLNPGKYNYSIVAIDKSNNKNISTGYFTINSPPCKPSLLNPENNSINVSINATLIAHVIDIDSDIMTVKFYGRKLGATWQLIGTKTNVENNSNVSLVWYNLEYNTTYEWYAVANDSFFENSSDTWQFTTQKAPPVNNPPVANNDYYSTNEDIQLVISALGVLANDTDIDGDTLTAIKLTDPSHGSIVFNSNGSFVYTPSLNYYGTDSFTYKAYDGKAYSNVATVHITVNPVNDAPNKPALLYPSNGATGISINPTLSWQCSDADGDELSYDIYFGTSPNPPKIVTVTTISYNPGTLSYSTTYYWRVVAKDGKEETPSDIWQFTTMAYTPSPPAANQPPTCSLNANVSHGYAPLYVNFIMNASDADGNIIAWELDVNNDGIAEYNGSALPSTVQHVYANPGNFKAKLIVRDDKGAISTANISIYVISVDFEFIPQKPAPGVGVKFFALFDAINYTWNFGDGSFAYGRNVSHAFAKEGKYRVKLIVSDGIYYYEKNYTIDVVIPDFYVEAIYLPEKPKKGDEIKIFLKIKNDGGYSENVGCYIFLDGEKQSFRFNISEEYEKEIHCVGISKIKIFVDPENEIEEKNERNNGIEISIKYAGNNLIYLAFIPVVAIPAYLLIRRKKEKKVIMGEEKIEKCSVCLGSFKEEANILRCDCGALYHKSCAKRVKNCINCNKKL
ncbi:MAG: tandem-95 repeat protein, partial [Candidatus Thermoplasmatota archaeon]